MIQTKACFAVITLLTASATVAAAQDAKPKNATPAASGAATGGARRQTFYDIVLQGITLSPTQRDSIDKLRTSLGTENVALKADMNANGFDEERATKFETKRYNLLLAALTPEQRPVFERNYKRLAEEQGEAQVSK
jgi:Spy/CpxP family protein refolding chaperone